MLNNIVKKLLLIISILCLILIIKNKRKHGIINIDDINMDNIPKEVNQKIEQSEIELIKEEYNDLKEEYIGVIEIPRIKLQKNFFDKKDKNNDVNKNVTVLKESRMPDEENSNLILASHSGLSKVAFFNDLSKLQINDEVYIFYKGYKYLYCVYKIFEVEKDGRIIINRNIHDKYLTLITCKIGTNKQYVVICKLTNEEKII